MVDDPLHRGVALFNERAFFEAHEAWEELWRAARGGDREFLQGLIQLAAAYHHVQRGTSPRGAVRLFASALRRLDAFPSCHMGVDRESAVTAAQEHRENVMAGGKIDADGYPKLGLCGRP